jgi:hypothetical protein
MFSTVQCVPVIEVEQWSHSLDYSVAGHDYLSPSRRLLEFFFPLHTVRGCSIYTVVHI